MPIGAQIGIWSAEHFIEVLNKAATLLIEHPDHKKEMTGGYFAIWYILTGFLIFLTRVGDINSDEEKKYHPYCLEKGTRILKQLCDGNVIISSWQTRDELLERYGGAITSAKNYILSFSGFTEKEDEALTTVVAYKLNFISYDQLLQIADISSNELIDWLQREMDYPNAK